MSTRIETSLRYQVAALERAISLLQKRLENVAVNTAQAIMEYSVPAEVSHRLPIRTLTAGDIPTSTYTLSPSGLNRIYLVNVQSRTIKLCKGASVGDWLRIVCPAPIITTVAKPDGSTLQGMTAKKSLELVWDGAQWQRVGYYDISS